MKAIAISLAALFCLAAAGSSRACDGCGKADCCGKTCRVVCTMKEVKKTVWAVECGCICPTLPGCCRDRCCASCGSSACGAEGCCGTCGKGCSCMAPPQCGKIRSVKKLVKKEIVCKVPVYQCVVVDCCGGGCGRGAERADTPPQKAPPAPEAAPLPRR